MTKIPRVLTIAGSDSGGGAGIQADLKTFCAFGVYGMSVITAATAQNTLRVNGVEPLSPDFVSLQFESILSDIGVDAVKTGMLFSADIIDRVAQKLKENKILHVVVDPVMVAKGGDRLLQASAVEMLKNYLIPQASLVTPNIPEAEVLAEMTIETNSHVMEAALKIHKLGCKAVLIKGGHLPGDATDVLFDGDHFWSFEEKRIDSRNTHGTGCTYSSAIAANLAKGHSLKEAVTISKAFITEAIRQAFNLGKGHGPLNHFVRVKGMEGCPNQN